MSGTEFIESAIHEMHERNWLPHERSRMLKIHWYRAKNCWSVVFSDHCEHYKRLVIKATFETVLSDKSIKAFLKGRGRLIRHGDWAEVVP